MQYAKRYSKAIDEENILILQQLQNDSRVTDCAIVDGYVCYNTTY